MASNQQELSILNINKDTLMALEGEQEWKVYQAALLYINAGLLVLPLRKNGKKLPPHSTGINYGSASKNKSTIEKWFNPSTGRFRGWNIGLATGRRGGIFVVDIDKHGEVDGEVIFNELQDAHGEVSSPVQSTPSGGSHLIFQWEDNGASSTGKIGPGVDTRGGTEDACKGHIVAFPSRVDGKEYVWAVGGPVPLVPDWIMSRMGKSWAGKGRGNEFVDDEDLEQAIPPGQLQRMLEAIDIDDLSYEQWLRIGQAVNSQYPDEKGLEIWDDWSKTGERYKANECRVRWRGFDPAGAVRAGTLFYFAKKYGWEPQEDDVGKNKNKIEQIIESMNEDYAIIMVGGKIRVLREKRDPPNPTDNKYDLLGVRDFQIYMANNTVNLGGDKPAKIGDLWLAHPARREYPNGLILDPEGHRSDGAYNTWSGFNVTPVAGPCQLFLNHILEVVCCGDEDHYNWVLDWLADLFQDPANPKGCCIVMRGPEGAGKGTLANTIGEMFGPHYRHLIDDAHLLSNFNAHMIDALFVFADEITWGGNKKTAGKLKGMVTEKYLVGERKGVDAVGYRNMIHMMIASNAEWVIPAGANSRRWFVLDVKEDRRTDLQYFRDINDELNNGGREAILHMLLHREITNDLRRAPETEALQKQRRLSYNQDSIIGWWVNILEREEFPDDIPDIDLGADPIPWPENVRKDELHANYEAWCERRKMRSESLMVFCDKLKPLGFDLRARVKRNGKNLRVARPPKLPLAKELLEKYYNIKVDEDGEG